MFHIVLYEPEIPPNTGNVMRLAANTGCRLHLLGPLGFDLDEKSLRRAGLDYRDHAGTRRHDSFAAFVDDCDFHRLYAFTTRASQPHTGAAFRPGDALLFGPESRGLPADILDSLAPQQRLRLPMIAGSRSLNLSNAVAVAVYEAWRQQDFRGAAP